MVHVTTVQQMKKTDPKTPSNRYLKLIMLLPRKLASILTQLRMGHALLVKFLHRIRKTDSPMCPTCQQAKEMISHLILHCPTHDIVRQTLWNDTGGRDINIMKLLTMQKSLCTLFTFVAEMGHWHSTMGELPMLGEEQNRNIS